MSSEYSLGNDHLWCLVSARFLEQLPFLESAKFFLHYPLIILGSSISFAKGVEASGLGNWLATSAIGLFGGYTASAFFIFAVFVLLNMIITCVMSATSSIAIFAPIGISLASSLGCDPMLFVMGTVMGAKCGSATPICTAPVTMTLVAGYRFLDYFIMGGLISVICYIVTITVLPAIYL